MISKVVERTCNTHLLGLKQGSLDSFKWVYDAYHEKVYYFSLSFTKSPPDAEEITSDVFTKIWEKRTIIDPSRSLLPLLYKITKDLTWNYLKRTARIKRQREVFCQNYKYASTHGENVIIFGEYQAMVNKALKELPPQQGKIFVLRYLDGRDLGQIAEDLSISKNTVKSHLAKSKRYVLDYLAL